MDKTRWIRSALCLGAVFFFAIFLVKPLGVSTQYSVLSGIFHNAIDESIIDEDDTRESGYASKNEYYDKSEGKLAKSIKEPWDYDFVFVLSIPVGALIAYTLNNHKKKSEMSDIAEVHGVNQKRQSFIRLVLPSFIGGFILLYGARMAGGCTSGHMMSGMMQGSISGYIFAATAFLTAIPTAIIIGKISGGKK